jgi:hypoxanthine phosphoribosyltransferase
MLDKPARRTCNTFPKYIGAEIEDKFIIGFGLDYNEKYRNIPYVGVINKKYI